MALNLSGGVLAYERMLDNFGKVVSYTPVTKTTSNITGEESLSDGTPGNVTLTFYKRDEKYSQEIQGLMDNADAVVLAKNALTLEKDSKITYQGEVYRIDNVLTRRLGTNVFYKYAQCFLIE